MHNLITNINQAISDFNSIKTAINSKGANMPDGTPTSLYGEYIMELNGSSSAIDGKYVTDGLIKHFKFSDFTGDLNLLISLNGSIEISENMTIEVCGQYHSFQKDNKGRFYEISYGNASNAHICFGVSLFNNYVEISPPNGTWIVEEQSGLTLPPDSLHTITLTYDTIMQLYSNGVNINSFNYDLSSHAGYLLQELSIKRGVNRSDRNLNGVINSLRIYNRRLTDSEILLNAQADQQIYGSAGD